MTDEKRDVCMGTYEHAWTIKNARGHDEVHCARCMQCLGVDRMMRAYVKLHGGTVTR